MKTRKILVFGLLACFLSTGYSFGQGNQGTNAGYDRFSIGLQLGLFFPYGDVREWRYLPTPDELSFGGGLSLMYTLSPVFTLRSQFLLGSLKGNDREEGFRFESNFLDANLQGLVSFTKFLAPRWEGNTRFDLYGGVGLGFVGYRTLLYRNNVLHREVGYSGRGTVKEPRSVDLHIPLSLGMRYNVSPRIDVFVETSFRFSKTDDLDGLDRPFSQNDAYNFSSVGVAIKLGPNRKALSWASPSTMMYPGDVARVDEITNRLGVVERRVTEVDRVAAVDAQGKELQVLRNQVQAMQQKQDEVNQNIMSLMEGQVKPEDHLTSVASLLSVFFRLNSAEIDNFNYERIAAAARFLNANPNLRLEVIGHTDISGPSAFNSALSERRARAVYNVLVRDFNIDSARLHVTYKGEDEPIADPALRINRRVEFRVVE